MTYQKLNNFTGWGVWLVATAVYLLTIEPTASFWDCGEFIASAYKLEVGHPPGAPFFMLLARFLMIFGTPENAAVFANALSALSSSFTILFLFWSITHLTRKLVRRDDSTESFGDRLAIMGAGAVGALAYTFSDSFWFSAVEGEVYALSSLFTAAVFWAILKWENAADEPGHLRWILVIAYLMGLSIGVHLLNLLAIPAIALVYYFKKFEFSWKGLAITLAISVGLLGFVQEGLIKGVVNLAGKFELFFVNDLGLSFNSGVLAYSILLVGFLTSAIWWTHKKGWWAANTFVLGMTLVLIGYSTFAVIVIRSAANPPMDENNPEDLFALLSYLNREQYGSRPLATGEYWGTPVETGKSYLDGRPTYVKSFSVYENKGRDVRIKSFRSQGAADAWMKENGNARMWISEEYVDSGEKKGQVPNYDSRFTMVFPRMWSSQANHQEAYKQWSNYKGYNESFLFEVPGLDRGLNSRELEQFVADNYLQAGLKKEDRIRGLNALFSANRRRLNAELFQVASDDVVQVMNPRSGRMESAPLNSPGMADAVAQFLVADLESGMSRGSGYVQSLESQKRQLELQLRYAASSGDAQGMRQAQNMLDRVERDLKPTMSENLRYFQNYQMGWMYFRYFLWNFSGRQNDTQGHGDFLDGNWISGIPFIDAERLGNQSELTESQRANKGFNRFYYLPLILGLIGLFFHAFRDHRQFLVVLSLFVLTGVAIVVYLNQYPFQPRERDYAYVGSFYAFAIWIGIGVFALYDWIRNLSIENAVIIAGSSVGVGVLSFLTETIAGSDHALSWSLLYMSVMVILLLGIALVLKLLQNQDSIRAIVMVGLSLIVPALMASEGWDDHNRAKRRTGVDFAKNYLDSLAPNAILFTNGDNDTFPLWYAQEVEGHRTDVRICNLSLLNTDWYIDQMKRQAYESAPVPIRMPEEGYRQGTRDLVILDDPKDANNPYMDLGEALEVALDDQKLRDYQGGKSFAYFPTNAFRVPVDSATIAGLGFLTDNEMDELVDAIEFTLTGADGKPKGYILKNQLAVLDMIHNNNWERPIYFAVTTGPDSYMGLQEFFRLEGLAYRLVPIRYPESENPNAYGGVQTDLMYDNIMEKWSWGGMDDVANGIYMDENNRRMVTNFRLQMSILAEELLKEDKPSKALDICALMLEKMPNENVPMSRVLMTAQTVLMELAVADSIPGVKKIYKLEEDERKLAKALAIELTQDLFQLHADELVYYHSLDKKRFDSMSQERRIAKQVAEVMIQTASVYLPDDSLATDLTKKMEEVEAIMVESEMRVQTREVVKF
ncbi:MAG: DUF2723 domain-containing protein [Bacteroidetes bacterium]|nr:DUF2723 domain-containing protein [Bacteroidota bacterium]